MDLLELLGKRYVIDHCVNYLNRKSEEKIFRLYVADALRAISKNTSMVNGGTYIEESYGDIISGKTPKKEDADPEEIKNRISNKLAEIGSRKEDKHGLHGVES